MKNIFFISFLLFVFVHANSQSILPGGFVNGYLIKNEDTTKCWINKKSDFDKKIEYILSPDEKKRQIPSSEVTGFIIGSALFEAIEFDRHRFFARVQIRGPVSLYERCSPLCEGISSSALWISDRSGAGFSIPTGIEYPECIYYMQKEDVILQLDQRSFNEDLEFILSENKEMIKKYSAYKYQKILEEIEAIVNNYNAWLLEQ